MKTATQNYTSRTADKFVVRLPEGMRDRIAHDYEEIHVGVLWSTIHTEIPQLQAATSATPSRVSATLK